MASRLKRKKEKQAGADFTRFNFGEGTKKVRSTVLPVKS